MNNSLKAYAWTIGGGVGLYLLFGGIKAFQIYQMLAHAQFQMPPEAVTVSPAAFEPWPDVVEVTGDILPLHGALLRAEESGRVARVAAVAGTTVAAGTVIVALEAQAEEGELRAAEARATLAGLQLARARTMRADNLNALADLNRAEAEHAEALGQVDAWRGRLRLKQIVAPFAGKVGVVRIQEGDYVERGTPVVQVDDDATLRVRFSFPDTVAVNLGDAVEIVGADEGNVAPVETKVSAVDPAVDRLSRQRYGEAQLPGGEGIATQLRSGSFARVRLISNTERRLWKIPAAGIAYAPYGNSVFVVEEKADAEGKTTLTVRQQFIDIVSRRGDFVGARGDLKEGERVVNAGAFKLRPGAAIMIRSDIEPKNEMAPQPRNS